MESKNEFKKIHVKNHMFYYFFDTVKARDIYSVDTLLDKNFNWSKTITY